jgi:2-iminobutanoate/2-iminopropanoate deaminase
MTLRNITRILITAGSLCSLTAANAGEAWYYVTPESAALNLPFSDAVIFNGLLVMSGQLGVDPATFKLVEGGIEAETHRIFSNMKALLAAHDASLADIVKCTVMIADISQWPAFNTIYLGYFPEHKPARSALGANGLALNAAVELECWAALGD